jgi:hypothetical protein
LPLLTKHSKKQLIAGLLFACCAASAVLLFSIPSGATKRLENFSQADSLLHLTFDKFDLQKNQISVHSVVVDSNFTRKSYTLSVSPGFPKTEFHLDLQNRLHSYGIELPAQIIFPERRMQIQLIYHQTIMASIKINNINRK